MTRYKTPQETERGAHVCTSGNTRSSSYRNPLSITRLSPALSAGLGGTLPNLHGYERESLRKQIVTPSSEIRQAGSSHAVAQGTWGTSDGSAWHTGSLPPEGCGAAQHPIPIHLQRDLELLEDLIRSL